MASRPLTSLALPSHLLGKLMAVGYTTVSELRDLDADSLANGPCFHQFAPRTTRFSSFIWNTELKLPIEACSEILGACNASSSTAIAGFLPSQPASSLLTNRAAFGCGVPSLDSLINGGLKKGEVLEISGPPGSGKTQLALEFVKAAVSAGDEVLVMGTSHTYYVVLQNKVLELI
jgi:RAD51-like protein 2